MSIGRAALALLLVVLTACGDTDALDVTLAGLETVAAVDEVTDPVLPDIRSDEAITPPLSGDVEDAATAVEEAK